MTNVCVAPPVTVIVTVDPLHRNSLYNATQNNTPIQQHDITRAIHNSGSTVGSAAQNSQFFAYVFYGRSHTSSHILSQANELSGNTIYYQSIQCSVICKKVQVVTSDCQQSVARATLCQRMYCHPSSVQHTTDRPAVHTPGFPTAVGFLLNSPASVDHQPV